MAFDPLSKEFYAVKEFELYIPAAGPAHLAKLLPSANFINGLEKVFATAADWRASYIILAESDPIYAAPALLRTLAVTLLGCPEPIAILYADGQYILGSD